MTYSILLLGVASTLGHKVARYLEVRTEDFARVAVLRPLTAVHKGKGFDAASTGLEHITGSPTDPDSYNGFDIVVSMVEDDLCRAQKEYIDAAIAGGVKHFYPAEYGADTAHTLAIDESYSADKIYVRKHLEARAHADSFLGYTYLMTGVQAELLLEANLLGLSEDKASAIHLGHPDAKVSTTHGDDAARVIVTSLLPRHLSILSMKRRIRFAGSTLTTSSLYDALSYVLHHPIDVTYRSPEAPYKEDKQPKGSDDNLPPKIASFRRSLGFGEFELKVPDDEEESGKGIIDSGKEYVDELEPKSWSEVVHEYFTRRKEHSTTAKKG